MSNYTRFLSGAMEFDGKDRFEVSRASSGASSSVGQSRCGLHENHDVPDLRGD